MQISYILEVHNQLIDCMRFSHLFTTNQPQNSDLKQSTKEQFFTVKRKHKRLKSSAFLTQQLLNQEPKHQKTTNHPTLPTTCPDIQKDLQSTFGSDHFLRFRSKQPKRKTKLKSKLSQEQKGDSQSQSEGEQTFTNLNGQISPLKSSTFIPEKEKNVKLKSWKIDDFICLGKIGEGSYSEVFRVLEKRSGFICSLKVLKKQKLKELKLQQNLFREIKISLFLNNPHIIKLYGCFADQVYVYLLFELATEQNLYELLTNHKMKHKQPISIEQTKAFIAQLCFALNYMHQNNILHRDIKPQNILITFTNNIKVCDFGWSIYNPDKSLRATLCGTPLYLAPQLIKQNVYNELVDVWATGVLTYELLTNEIPFKIKSVNDLKKVVTQEIKFDKITDPQAKEFISFALQKQKEERKNMNELIKCKFIDGYLLNEIL